MAEEILFSTLATLHNIRYYFDIMRRIRRAILRGEFPGLSTLDQGGLLIAEIRA